MAFQDLVARVDAIDPVRFDALTFRHLSPGYDPRSGVGARINGGRWNPPDSFSTLYLALSKATAAAEWKRAAAAQNLALEDFLPRELHQFDLRLSAAIDLRADNTIAAIGLSPDDFRSDDPQACRRIGEAAQYLGLEAVVAPSATGNGDVVAVFLDRLQPGSHLEVVGSELWVVPDDAD